MTRIALRHNTTKLLIYGLTLCLLLFAACGRGKTFTLKGTIEGGTGKSLYIEELTPEGALFIDSIAIDSKGHYKFRCDVKYTTFFYLHHSPVDYVVLIADANDKLVVNASYENITESYTVEGSTESTLLWQLQKYSNDGVEQLREIVAQNNSFKTALASNSMSQAEYDAHRQQLDSLYSDTRREQQQYIARFIQDNQGSLATLIALYKPFNSKPLIAPEVNFDFYELVLEGLQNTLPDNPHTLHFKNTVEHLRHRYGSQNAVY